MGRIACASILVLLFSALAPAQVQPICDVTCEPNPGGGGYNNTVQARTKTYNVRGSNSVTAQPAAKMASAALRAKEIPGSESYNYAIPILHLPGRNGLDLDLTLYYNSRVWTIDKTALTVTLNADRDFPSYGFRFGFGYLEYSSSNNNYTLTEPDGTKRLLTFT
ncbi:MAG TPA: hypothetical protein VGQ71_10905, partial [Terriglobales bacterium]|nr:hypothetical protein [Terriglobales bacterium]